MNRVVKVYGERHTGTRLVERVLRKGSDVTLTASGAHFGVAHTMALRALTALPQPVSKDVERMLREALTDDLTLADGPIGAWKHAAAHFDPEFAANDVHVLFVVKSPGAWLTSIYRRPYHRQNPRRGSLHYFTTSPWICVRRELTPNVVANPIALWNIKVRSYLDFAKKARGANVKCMFVRSEDLILDQVNTVHRMADWLGIEPAVPIVELTSDTVRRQVIWNR